MVMSNKITLHLYTLSLLTVLKAYKRKSMEKLCCTRIEVDEKLIKDAIDLLDNEDIHLKRQARFFSLFGNEVRLKIVRLLSVFRRMCVCDLSDVLGMKQSPVSQHLRKLKDGGILISKREGMTIFYMINPSAMDEVKKFIKDE